MEKCPTCGQKLPTEVGYTCWECKEMVCLYCGKIKNWPEDFSAIPAQCNECCLPELRPNRLIG